MSPSTARLRDRRVSSRGKPRPSILILCEGTKTEPAYFHGFRRRISSVQVQVIGLAMNTRSLVDEAIARRNDEQPDRCWCVFDRDSFPAENVNAAIERARANDCQVAFSNECFELWYLLHFHFIDSALSRVQYGPMLTERLGRRYEKNDEEMYEALLSRQEDAIRHARKLLARYPNWNPANDNPSTTVHLLVEELNQHIQ